MSGRPAPSPLIGTAQLAIGQAAGMARFEGTVQAFLASLAPLIALSLVMTAWAAFRGYGVVGFTLLALFLVVELAPPVLSHHLAVRWGREGQWLRYVTARNWCQWAVPVVGILMIVLLQLGVAGDLTDMDAVGVILTATFGYELWLSWFVARHGLMLSRGRAALLVLFVDAGVLVLIAVLPRLLSLVMGQGLNGSGS